MSSRQRSNVRSTSRIRSQARSRAASRKGSVEPTFGGEKATQLLLRTPSIFQTNFRMKSMLYYTEVFNVASALGLLGTQVFSANGAYDPDITGTGHQPLGFDNLMTLYDQYVVRSATIKCKFVGLTASTSRIAIHLNDDSKALSSVSSLVENAQLATDVIATSTTAGFHSIRELELHCDVPKYFRCNWDELKRNPSYQGTASGNPTEQVYFHVSLWGYTASNATVGCDAVISYDIEFFEPKHIASS